MIKTLMKNILKKKSSPALVVCRDSDCESRQDCPHSKPHTRIEECQFSCDPDWEHAKCYPVKEAI